MGNTLPTDKAHSKPQFQFTFNKQMQKNIPQASAYVPQDDDLFTLVMTDPDAPSKTDQDVYKRQLLGLSLQRKILTKLD